MACPNKERTEESSRRLFLDLMLINPAETNTAKMA